jgi:hypothetical protein
MGSHKMKKAVRFRELCELEVMVSYDYPELELPHLSKANWLNNHKTKVIEARKIIAENFL